MTQKTRDDLKLSFQDNAVPTGEDFANLIDSSLNQVDDGVTAVNQQLGLGTATPAAKLDLASDGSEKILQVKSSTATNPTLFVDENGALGVGTSTPQSAVDIQENVSITGELFATGPAFFDAQGAGFSVSNNEDSALYVNNQGYVGVGTFTPASDLDVAGNIQADSLTVQDRVSIDPSNGEALLNITNTVASQAPLRVQDENAQTQVLVDSDGRFAVGTDAPSAGLHIQINHESDVLRIDDQVADTTPLIINKDGQMGLGVDNPTNKLDVSGNMVVGANFAGVQGAPTNGLLVERKLGVGTLTPDAQFHVNQEVGSTDDHVQLSTDNAVWFSASDDGVNIAVDTEVSGFTAQGDALFAQKTVLQGEVSAEKELNVAGQSTLASVEVQGQSNLNGPVMAAQDVTVMGQATLKDAVICEKNLDVAGSALFQDEVNVDGVLNAKADLNVTQNAKVQGSTEFVGTVDSQDTLTVAGLATFNSMVDCNQDLRVRNAEGIPDTLRVTDTGQVGIHTDAPNAGLHIQGTPAQAALKVDAPSLPNVAYVSAQGDFGIGTDAPEAPFDVQRPARFTEMVNAENTVNVQGKLNANSTFNVQGASDFVGPIHGQEDVDFDGKLNVAGLASFEDSVAIDKFLVVKGPEGAPETLKVTDLGLVGVNNTEPMANLHVHGAVEQVALQVDTPVSDHALYINAQGQVGIGTDDPKAPFDVEPAARFADKVTAHADVEVLGPVNAHNTLNVQGETHLIGAVHAHSDVHIDGALDVDGMAHFDSAVAMEKSLVVAGPEGEPSTLSVTDNGKVGILTPSPEARLHVQGDSDEVAVKVTINGAGADALHVAKNGFVGVNTSNPREPLDVQGQALFSGPVRIDTDVSVGQNIRLEQDLEVLGKALVQDTLTVSQASHFIGPIQADTTLTVDGAVKAKNRVDIDGELNVKSPAHFEKGVESYPENPDAWALEAHGKALVTGMLSVNQGLNVQEHAEFEKTLRVKDSLDADANLTVAGPVRAQAQLDVDGALHAHNAATFDGPVRANAPVRMDAGLEINFNSPEGSALQVNGDISTQGNLRVARETRLQDALFVEGASEFNQAVMAKNNLSVGGMTLAKGPAHVQNTLRVDEKLTAQRDADFMGKVAVKGDVNIDGTLYTTEGNFTEMLKVAGSARFENDIRVNQHLQVDHYATISDDLTVNGQLQLAEGDAVKGISNDEFLGDEDSRDDLLCSQKAIKTYVDMYASAFSRGRDTYVINTQKNFEDLFGDGGPKRLLDEGLTILMLPRKERDPEMMDETAYILKNAVRLSGNTHIIGFNAATTCVQKNTADCRFEIVSETSEPISGVLLEGWTFDGTTKSEGPQAYQGNGGAFYLSDAKGCTLNCHLINHHVIGNGGAIYGQYSAQIKAKYIRHCQAMPVQSRDKNSGQGGGVYGLRQAYLKIKDCHAERGGAVAHCDESHVYAQGCDALYGGGAYYCMRLCLDATGCSAFRRGGGACFCESLTCKGYWMSNTGIDNTNNIYTEENPEEGHENRRHPWQGTYVGQRLMNTEWRHDNV